MQRLAMGQTTCVVPTIFLLLLLLLLLFLIHIIQYYSMGFPVRNWQRCTAPQNRFKIAVQLNYSCLAAF